MKLGLFVGALATGKTVSDQVADVVEAERRGFDSYWYAQTGETDVLTTLALAGRETERIELATGVVPTYTRHPNVMAQQAATVNQASGGRLTLGIGPSHRPVIEGLGLKYDRPARQLREYVEILRALNTEGQVQYEGEYYQLTARIGLVDAQPYPILISALAPLMLKAAGEVADGTITWMAGVTALRQHVVPKITEAASSAGRPAPRIVAGIPVAVHDDAEAARQTAGETFQVYGRLENYRRVLDRGEMGGPADVAVVGTETEVAEQLAAYAAAGVTDVAAVAYPVGDNAQASVDRTTELLASLVGTF
ncbi:MAG: TIGR03564 family F420-dependent LLM class oxidoreductase [Chloroflexi bacterium]|nr:TIGR03564 family F420-dependent LLM class oxidoreductase [Chloroflexota bacterium]MDA1147185.1 TIGR03564 family F420-dependent LLM class oxidoreductase [Chloroflexota bacterium]